MNLQPLTAERFRIGHQNDQASTQENLWGNFHQLLVLQKSFFLFMKKPAKETRVASTSRQTNAAALEGSARLRAVLTKLRHHPTNFSHDP